MNFIAPKDTNLLLLEASQENLYLKLVEQINKDFGYNLEIKQSELHLKFY